MAAQIYFEDFFVPGRAKKILKCKKNI